MLVRRFLVFFCILIAAGAESATVNGLYQADVPIASRSDGDRGRAMRAALGAVLVKLTGDGMAAAREALESVLRKAPQLMQQYQYLRRSTDPPNDALLLRVRFNPDALDEALRYTGFVIWGKERPLLLVWLAVADTSGSAFVNAGDASSDFTPMLVASAARRAIPLLLPLLDLEDSAALAVVDIGAGDDLRIIAASQRYRAQAVLVGMLEQPSPGLWEADWRLLLDEQSEQWSSEGTLPEIVIDEGIDRATDQLARRFARYGLEYQETGVQLTVQGVRSAAHYALAKKYLDSLDAIKSVVVKRIERGQVTFQVIARGGFEAVEQTIGLGTTLRPIPGHFDGYYRLVAP